MKTVKLRKVGNSFGFTIPKELIEKYNLKVGEKLHVIERNDGFMLTQYDPDFEKWSEAFHKTNKKYPNTFKELAK